MPNGVWETTDYIDVDPVMGEGMIPIHVKMTIDGDHVHYDLSGSHPTTISTFLTQPYAVASVFPCDFPAHDVDATGTSTIRLMP